MINATLKKCLTIFLLGGISQFCFADWVLNEQVSSVGFVSVKNAAVVESHDFKSLSGEIDEKGKVMVDVDLDSVETMIPIRNERMQTMLFQTEKFPIASIEANIDLKSLLAMQPGSSQTMSIDGKLEMHGQSVDVNAPVEITRISEDGFQVTSSKPVVLNASSWGLAAGIEALRTVAGLDSITLSVPVTFNFIFEKN